MTDDRSLKQYISDRLEYLIDQAYLSAGWESLWGVPCGPTLTQVPGHETVVYGVHVDRNKIVT